jgi:hypothetical protein
MDDILELKPFPLPCAEIGRPVGYEHGIGFSPRHALQLITGSGSFRIHPTGYDLVRRWSLSKDYKISWDQNGNLVLNGVGFIFDSSLPEDEGVWEPAEGNAQRFRFSLDWLSLPGERHRRVLTVPLSGHPPRDEPT